MPKYYVRDGYEKAIVEAHSPEEAALRAILTRFNSFTVNGYYVVSERGFEEHDDMDDTFFDSNYILDRIMEDGDDFEKKRKKDEEGY